MRGKGKKPCACCSAARGMKRSNPSKPGFIGLREQFFRRATAIYRDLLKNNPKLVVALVNLGESYGSSGHLDEAIALWREALKMNPCLDEAGTNLRIAFQAKSDAAGLDALSKSRSFCEFP